jgi:Protein of unknown function (DUF1257)
MSHFTRIKTKMVVKEFITQALDDLGYTWEEGDLKMKGFLGERTGVEIKIRRPGKGYEIGLRKSGPSYEIVADWYGVRGLGREEFRQQLTQRYAYHAACARLMEQGFDLVSEATEQDGRLHLVLRRVS